MSRRLETLRFLADSPHRVDILRVLRGDQRLIRSEIVSTVDASRRTVKRALDAFRERGWVTKKDGAYTLSVGGAFVLDAYEDFADRAALVDDLRPFFARVAERDCFAGPSSFEGATLVETDRAYPFTTVDYLLDRYQEATERVWVLLTYVSMGMVEEIMRKRPGGIGVTIILDENVQRAIADNLEYRELFADLDIAELYAIDESFPFSCALIDDHAALTVTDDHGMPSVLLGSSNPDFVTLIERRIRGCLERAEPFDPNGSELLDTP